MRATMPLVVLEGPMKFWELGELHAKSWKCHDDFAVTVMRPAEVDVLLYGESVGAAGVEPDEGAMVQDAVSCCWRPADAGDDLE